MNQSNCEWCGETLFSKTRLRRFCNRKHEYLHASGAPKSGVGACEFCGVSFSWRKGKKYCSRDCKEWAGRGLDPSVSETLKAEKRSVDTGLISENRQLGRSGEKRCSGCRHVKPLDQYAKSARGLYGVTAECLDCNAARNKRWLQSMDDARRTAHLAGRKKRDRLVSSEAAALRRIAAKVLKGQEKRRQDLQRRCRQQRKAQILRWCLESYREGDTQISALALFVMQSLNKQPWQLPGASGAEQYRWRYRIDPEFNAKERMRRQINKAANRLDINDKLRAAIARRGSSPSVEALVGYKASELRRHLERQFTRGMSWDAFMRGEIHIDHIVPVATFDLTDISEVSQCWALSNLRPCWAAENFRKSDKQIFLI